MRFFVQPEVGLVAINDGIMLELCIYKLLKRYFGSEQYYMELVELFLQVLWGAVAGG
jgi:farnesyl diphosphate synthase